MTVRIDDQPRHWRVQFDSLYEQVNWLAETPRVWDYRMSKDNPPEHSWDLKAGYDGALRLARDGWEDGILKMSALVGTVPSEAIFVKANDFAGEMPDVPRFLAGDPKSMIHRGRERKPKATMTIVLNLSASAIVNAEAIWNFGAAMVSIVDRLESQKVRCEVVAIWRSEDLGKSRANFSAATMLKQAEDALDLNAMAFGLAHPGMLRRIGFATMERSRWDMRDMGYGRPNSNLTEADIIVPTPGALFIGGIGMAYRECNTIESAIAYIIARMNEAAGEDIVELEPLE